MTIPTHVLEVRLAEAGAMAQRLLAGAPHTAPPNGRAAEANALWQRLGALATDLRRTLRQFTALQRQRASLESALAAAPSGEARRQAASRLTEFDDDLARAFRRAARLVSLLLQLHPLHGAAPGVEGAQAVHQFAAEAGQPLDQAQVRRTLHRLATQPLHLPSGTVAVEPGCLLESIFIVFALVASLSARQPRTA